MNGFDAWKTRPPEMPSAHGDRASWGLPTCCHDCAFVGRGDKVLRHHRDHRAHRLYLRDDQHRQPLAFACCRAVTEIRDGEGGHP